MPHTGQGPSVQEGTWQVGHEVHTRPVNKPGVRAGADSPHTQHVSGSSTGSVWLRARVHNHANIERGGERERGHTQQG